MIKIALVAALAAIVIYDAAVVPPAIGNTQTIERPRGLKGDRLPIRSPGAGCPDVAWPSHQRECVGEREQPARQTPAAWHVRIVATDHPSGHPPLIAN